MEPVIEARNRFREVVERARQDPSVKQTLETSPELLERAGVRSVDPSAAAREALRRAELSDDLFALRRRLDELADRATQDPKWRALLNRDPHSVLEAAGLTSDDACRVAAEFVQLEAPGGSNEMRCDFSCCRSAATDWSCAGSVLV